MKPVATYQKLRGGYYTPKPIADFLARWAIQTPGSQVLEPSCGDGLLLQSAIEALIECGAEKTTINGLVQGIELDPHEAEKASQRIQMLTDSLAPAPVSVGDFFAYCQKYLAGERFFDAIIGNPPFIRYQSFLPYATCRVASQPIDEFVGSISCGCYPFVEKNRAVSNGHSCGIASG